MNVNNDKRDNNERYNAESEKGSCTGKSNGGKGMDLAESGPAKTDIVDTPPASKMS
jgi:hypothetical protein